MIQITLYTTKILLYCEPCIVTNVILNRIRAIQGDEQGGWAVINAIPEPKGDGIEGIGLYPGSLSSLGMITSKGVCYMINRNHNLKLRATTLLNFKRKLQAIFQMKTKNVLRAIINLKSKETMRAN